MKFQVLHFLPKSFSCFPAMASAFLQQHGVLSSRGFLKADQIAGDIFILVAERNK